MSDGGKGSRPRPIPNYDHYKTNWDRIFEHNKQQTNKEEKNERTEKLQHSVFTRS